ncbi:MAG: hypothetical protein ACLSA6_19570 [Holdemania massiliensis]
MKLQQRVGAGISFDGAGCKMLAPVLEEVAEAGRQLTLEGER